MAMILYTEVLNTILEQHNIKKYESAYSGESAGLDLYATDDRTVWPAIGWSNNEGPLLIPTGIYLQLQPNEVGLIVERGSVVKTPVKVRAGIIDAGFSGEVFVNCVNLNSSPYQIRAGQKLPFQLIVVPFIKPHINFVSSERLETITQIYLENFSRGTGQVGSSDNH